jgi:putative FmdB family regulatory protein
MPNYNYHCKNCEASFSIYASMNDSRENITCDSCESVDVYRVYNRILTKSSGFSKVDLAPASSAKSSKSSGGGCGTCSSGGCGTCH